MIIWPYLFYLRTLLCGEWWEIFLSTRNLQCSSKASWKITRKSPFSKGGWSAAHLNQDDADLTALMYSGICGARFLFPCPTRTVNIAWFECGKDKRREMEQQQKKTQNCVTRRDIFSSGKAQEEWKAKGSIQSIGIFDKTVNWFTQNQIEQVRQIGKVEP